MLSEDYHVLYNLIGTDVLVLIINDVAIILIIVKNLYNV